MIGSISTSSPSTTSWKCVRSESSAVITQACSSSNLNTVPSPTIFPSASQKGAYRIWPAERPSMSLAKIRSAARRASRPWKSHLRSGDSSQTPTRLRTAWCSATGSPKWFGQSQPSHSVKSQPSSRSGASNAVWTVTSPAPLRALHSTRARTRGRPCARATAGRRTPSPPGRTGRMAPGRR